jgi:predicted transcriptional regulator
MAKKIRSFRLDDDTFEVLQRIATERNESQADVIENFIALADTYQDIDRETDERIKELETERAELKKELHAERIHSRLQSDRWDDERARLSANLDQERADNKKLHGILTAIGGKIQNTSLFGVKRLKNDTKRLFLTVTSPEPIQYDQ